jgi:outer membrane protein assembly factor BamB
VILVVDHDDDSFVVALDKRTGEEIWRCYRFVFGRNYASPVIWSFDERRFVVVTGSGLVTGYDLKTGTPAWYSRATAAVVNPTPVVAKDNGLLFVHGSSPSSGAKSSSFRSLLESFDESEDGSLQTTELPNSFLKTFVKQFDRDASGGIEEPEYSQFKEISQPFTKGMVALKSGGLGDLTETNVAWKESRSMPRTPSSLYHDGILYVVSEGGALQSINAESGKVLHKGRIAARGTVYSSPSMGDGKIYIGTRNGEISVVSAEVEWKNLHSASLGGEIQASPAIADGRVYFRTDQAIYCFGFADQQK